MKLRICHSKIYCFDVRIILSASKHRKSSLPSPVDIKKRPNSLCEESFHLPNQEEGDAYRQLGMFSESA